MNTWAGRLFFLRVGQGVAVVHEGLLKCVVIENCMLMGFDTLSSYRWSATSRGEHAASRSWVEVRVLSSVTTSYKIRGLQGGMCSDCCLTVVTPCGIIFFILVINQLDAQNFVLQ